MTTKNTAPKISKPRAPRTAKKAVAVAVEAVQEVQAQSLAPEAAVIAANVATEAPKAPVATLSCGVCHEAKDAMSFVVQPKSLGKDHPEQGVMCGDCHEDLVSVQKANVIAPGTYFNLLDSRKRDKAYDAEEAFVKKCAGRRERSLRCDGVAGEACGLYHGQIYKGKLMVMVSPVTPLRDGDLSLLPKPPVLCQNHKVRFQKRLEDANHGKPFNVKFIFGPDAIALQNEKIVAINGWRAKETARLADEKARLTAERARLVEQDRIQARADADLYNQATQPANNRPVTKRQNDRFSPSGNTHSSKLKDSDRRR